TLPGGTTVTVQAVSPGSNIIEFLGGTGVNTLSVDVPTTSPLSNGAVTDLGFNAGKGSSQHSAADRYFLDNVHLDGQLVVLLQPSNPADAIASASVGFLGVDIFGLGSLVGTADFQLKNPDDGTTKIPVKQLANLLSTGHFIYHTDVPHGGVVFGSLSIAGGLELTVKPTGALSRLGNLGAATLSLDDPDVLFAPPMLLFDPLGFGHSTINLSASAVALSPNAPAH